MSLPQAHPTPLDAVEESFLSIERVSYLTFRSQTAGVRCKATQAQSSEAARAVTAAATLGAKRRRSRAVTALAASLRPT